MLKRVFKVFFYPKTNFRKLDYNIVITKFTSKIYFPKRMGHIPSLIILNEIKF